MKSSRLQLKLKGEDGDARPHPLVEPASEEMPDLADEDVPSPLITTITNIKTGKALPAGTLSGLAGLVELLCSGMVGDSSGKSHQPAPFPLPTPQSEPAGRPAAAGSSSSGSSWEQFAHLAGLQRREQGEAAAIPTAAAAVPFPGFNWAASSAATDEEPKLPVPPTVPAADAAASEAPAQQPLPGPSRQPEAAVAVDAAGPSRWQHFLEPPPKASGKNAAPPFDGPTTMPAACAAAAVKPASATRAAPVGPDTAPRQPPAARLAPPLWQQHTEPQHNAMQQQQQQAHTAGAAPGSQPPQPAPYRPPAAAGFRAPQASRIQQQQQVVPPLSQPQQLPTGAFLQHQVGRSSTALPPPQQRREQQAGLLGPAAPSAGPPELLPPPHQQQQQQYQPPQGGSGGGSRGAKVLSTCPICGNAFAPRESNADVNAHIEECLSLAALDDF